MAHEQFESIYDYAKWLQSPDTPNYEDINRSIPILDKLLSLIYFGAGPNFDIKGLLSDGGEHNAKIVEDGYWEVADKHALSTLISKAYRQAQQQQASNVLLTPTGILSPMKANNIPANDLQNHSLTTGTKQASPSSSNNIFKLLLSPSLKKTSTNVTKFLDTAASLLFLIRQENVAKLVATNHRLQRKSTTVIEPSHSQKNRKTKSRIEPFMAFSISMLSKLVKSDEEAFLTSIEALKQILVDTVNAVEEASSFQFEASTNEVAVFVDDMLNYCRSSGSKYQVEVLETLVGIALLKADTYLIMKIVHVLISIDLLPKHTEETSLAEIQLDVYHFVRRLKIFRQNEDKKLLGFNADCLGTWLVREKKFDSGQQENSHERQNTLNRPSFQRSNSTISKSKIVHANQSKVDWKKVTDKVCNNVTEDSRSKVEGSTTYNVNGNKAKKRLRSSSKRMFGVVKDTCINLLYGEEFLIVSTGMYGGGVGHILHRYNWSRVPNISNVTGLIVLGGKTFVAYSRLNCGNEASIGFSSEAPTKVKETVHTKAEHCIVTLATVKDGVVCSIDDDNSFVFKLMLRELLDSVYLDNDLHVCATNSGNAVLVYVHDKVIIYKIPETLSKVGICKLFPMAVSVINASVIKRSKYHHVYCSNNVLNILAVKDVSPPNTEAHGEIRIKGRSNLRARSSGSNQVTKRRIEAFALSATTGKVLFKSYNVSPHLLISPNDLENQYACVLCRPELNALYTCTYINGQKLVLQKWMSPSYNCMNIDDARVSSGGSLSRTYSDPSISGLVGKKQLFSLKQLSEILLKESARIADSGSQSEPTKILVKNKYCNIKMSKEWEAVTVETNSGYVNEEKEKSKFYKSKFTGRITEIIPVEGYVKIRNKQTLQMTPNANSIFTICEIPIGVCISVVELCQNWVKVGMTYDGTHILGWIYIGAILQLPQTVRSDDSKKSNVNNKLPPLDPNSTQLLTGDALQNIPCHLGVSTESNSGVVPLTETEQQRVRSSSYSSEINGTSNDTQFYSDFSDDDLSVLDDADIEQGYSHTGVQPDANAPRISRPNSDQSDLSETVVIRNLGGNTLGFESATGTLNIQPLTRQGSLPDLFSQLPLTSGSRSGIERIHLIRSVPALEPGVGNSHAILAAERLRAVMTELNDSVDGVELSSLQSLLGFATGTNHIVANEDDQDDGVGTPYNLSGSPPWAGDPKLLVGRRISVRWAGNKWYKGFVRSYNALTNRHLVLYDDGDMKQYVMSQKTFRLIPEENALDKDFNSGAKNLKTSFYWEQLKHSDNSKCKTASNYNSDTKLHSFRDRFVSSKSNSQNRNSSDCSLCAYDSRRLGFSHFYPFSINCCVDSIKALYIVLNDLVQHSKYIGEEYIVNVLNLLKLHFEIATHFAENGATHLRLPTSLRAQLLQILFSLSKKELLNSEYIYRLSQQVIVSGILIFSPSSADLLELISSTIVAGNSVFILELTKSLYTVDDTSHNAGQKTQASFSPLKTLVRGMILKSNLRRQVLGKVLGYSLRISLNALEILFGKENLNSENSLLKADHSLDGGVANALLMNLQEEMILQNFLQQSVSSQDIQNWWSDKEILLFLESVPIESLRSRLASLNIKSDKNLGSVDLFKLYVKNYVSKLPSYSPTRKLEQKPLSLYEKMRLDEKEYSISEYFKDLCSNSIIMLDIVTVYINSLKNAQHQKVIGMLQILKGSFLGLPFQLLLPHLWISSLSWDSSILNSIKLFLPQLAQLIKAISPYQSYIAFPTWNKFTEWLFNLEMQMAAFASRISSNMFTVKSFREDDSLKQWLSSKLLRNGLLDSKESGNTSQPKDIADDDINSFLVDLTTSKPSPSTMTFINWMHFITPGYPLLLRNSPIWRAFSKSERLTIAVLLHHSGKSKLAHSLCVDLYRMEQLGLDIEATTAEMLQLQNKANGLKQIWQTAYKIGRWTLQRAQTLKWWNLTIQEASVYLSDHAHEYGVDDSVGNVTKSDRMLASFVNNSISNVSNNNSLMLKDAAEAMGIGGNNNADVLKNLGEKLCFDIKAELDRVGGISSSVIDHTELRSPYNEASETIEKRALFLLKLNPASSLHLPYEVPLDHIEGMKESETESAENETKMDVIPLDRVSTSDLRARAVSHFSETESLNTSIFEGTDLSSHVHAFLCQPISSTDYQNMMEVLECELRARNLQAMRRCEAYDTLTHLILSCSSYKSKTEILNGAKIYMHYLHGLEGCSVPVREKVSQTYLRLARAICTLLNNEIENNVICDNRANAWIKPSRGIQNVDMSRFGFIKTALEFVVQHYKSEDSEILFRSKIIQCIGKLLLQRNQNSKTKQNKKETIAAKSNEFNQTILDGFDIEIGADGRSVESNEVRDESCFDYGVSGNELFKDSDDEKMIAFNVLSTNNSDGGNILVDNDQVFSAQGNDSIDIMLSTKLCENFEITSVYIRCPCKNPFVKPLNSIMLFVTSDVPNSEDFDLFNGCSRDKFQSIPRPNICTDAIYIDVRSKQISNECLNSGVIDFDTPLCGKYLVVKLIPAAGNDGDIGLEHIAFRGFTATTPRAMAVDNSVIISSSNMNNGDDVYVVEKSMTGVTRHATIIDNRTNNDLSEVEYLVKFRGWSARWNEWIRESSNRLFQIPESSANLTIDHEDTQIDASPASAEKENKSDHAWMAFISPLQKQFKTKQAKSPFNLASVVYANESISAKLPYFEVKFLESKMEQADFAIRLHSNVLGKSPKLFDNENSLLTFYSSGKISINGVFLSSIGGTDVRISCFGVSDVIGIGINLENSKLYVTLNGHLELSIPIIDLIKTGAFQKTGGLYPSLLMPLSSKVKFNFGESQFEYAKMAQDTLRHTIWSVFSKLATVCLGWDDVVYQNPTVANQYAMDGKGASSTLLVAEKASDDFTAPSPVSIQKTFLDTVFKALKYKYYKSERELHGLLCILADHCDSVAWQNYPFEFTVDPKEAILNVIVENGYSSTMRVQRICIRLLRFILPRHINTIDIVRQEGGIKTSNDNNMTSITTINKLLKKIGNLLLLDDIVTSNKRVDDGIGAKNIEKKRSLQKHETQSQSRKNIFRSNSGGSQVEKYCTHSDTGQQCVKQDWFHCLTCGIIDQNGVCAVCAKKCHAGHDVVFANRGRADCECGASTKNSDSRLPRSCCISMPPVFNVLVRLNNGIPYEEVVRRVQSLSPRNMCNSTVVVELGQTDDGNEMKDCTVVLEGCRRECVNNAKTLATTGLQTIVVEKVSSDAALRNDSIRKTFGSNAHGQRYSFAARTALAEEVVLLLRWLICNTSWRNIILEQISQCWFDLSSYEHLRKAKKHIVSGAVAVCSLEKNELLSIGNTVEVLSCNTSPRLRGHILSINYPKSVASVLLENNSIPITLAFNELRKLDEIPCRNVIELFKSMFVEKHFKAVNEFLRKDLSLIPSSTDKSKSMGIREHWSHLFIRTRIFGFLLNLVHLNPPLFTEKVVDSLSWVESLGQPSSAVLTLTDVKAKAACAALTMSDNSFDLKNKTTEHMDKKKSSGNCLYPTGWNTDLSWHMMFIESAMRCGSDELSTEVRTTALIADIVQFAGFPFRKLKEDPRRAEQSPGRRSECVVAVGNRPIPSSASNFYFEVTVVSVDSYNFMQDHPGFSVGLWSDVPGTRTSNSGLEWGLGSYSVYSKSGRKGSWSSLGVSHEIDFRIGAPLDVEDYTGVIRWRPARVIAESEDKKQIQVHFIGWEDKWNIWMEKSSKKIAPFRTHTRGPRPAGFMEKEEFTESFGQAGDVIGCGWNADEGTIFYTLNGKSLGLAFTNVFGIFYPAVAFSNQCAALRINFGDDGPFMYTTQSNDSMKTSVGGDGGSATIDRQKRMLHYHNIRLSQAKIDEEIARKIEEDIHVGTEELVTPCECWYTRQMAIPLADMFDGGEVMVQAMMRVLNAHGQDPQRAAEWALTHTEELSNLVNGQPVAEECSRHSHVVFSGRYLNHNVSSFAPPPPPAPGLTLKVTLADPPHAETPLLNASDVAGTCVLVDRGNVAFSVKIRNCQSAGALGVVVVSTEGLSKDWRMGLPENDTDDGSDIRIPAVMISFEDGELIKQHLLDHESGQIILKTGVSPQNTNVEGSVMQSIAYQDHVCNLNVGQSVNPDDASRKDVEKRCGNNSNEVLYKSDANMEAIHVGDYVRVRQNISEPVLGWDGVRHNCVGLVKAIHGTPGSDLVSAIVQFREQENWEGLVDDLELANEPDPVAVGDSKCIVGDAPGDTGRTQSLAGGLDEKLSEPLLGESSKVGESHIFRRRAVRPWKTKVALDLACFNHTTSSSVILDSCLEQITPNECFSREEEMYLQSSDNRGISRKKMEWLESVILLLQQRHIPPRTSQLILQVLQSGGAENAAMARMMLDDIGLSLPEMPVELHANSKFLRTGYCLHYVGRSLQFNEIWRGMPVRIIEENTRDTQPISGLEHLYGHVGQVIEVDNIKKIALVEFQDNEKNVYRRWWFKPSQLVSVSTQESIMFGYGIKVKLSENDDMLAEKGRNDENDSKTSCDQRLLLAEKDYMKLLCRKLLVHLKLLKYHNSHENTTDKKSGVDGKAEFYKMLYSHNTLKNIAIEFDRNYKFRNSSALVSFAKGLLYDKPSVPVKLLENVMLQIRKHTMDVKLRRDERRCLRIEIPDGMGISLQFSKQSKLKNDEAIDIFSDSSCTTLVHSVRKPLYPITLTHSSIWIRFKQQNFRNSSVDSEVIFQVSPLVPTMKFAFWLMLQVANSNVDVGETEAKSETAEMLRSYMRVCARFSYTPRVPQNYRMKAHAVLSELYHHSNFEYDQIIGPLCTEMSFLKQQEDFSSRLFQSIAGVVYSAKPRLPSIDKKLMQWLECIEIIDCICNQKAIPIKFVYKIWREHGEILKSIAPDIEDVLLLMKSTFDKQKDETLVSLACDILQQNKRVTLDSIRAMAIPISFKLLQDIPVELLYLRWLILNRVNFVIKDTLVWSNYKFVRLDSSMSNFFSKCRKLILSSNKFQIVTSVLEATSTASEQDRPRIVINRYTAASALQSGEQYTIFGQAMEQILGIERINPWRLCPRTADMAPPHLAFEVKFQKENVVGEGGPYREFFDEVCRELQSSDGLLSLLVPCPNQLLSFGENREKFIPGARRTDYLSLKKYEFLGRLMGMAVRTGVKLALDLPSIFWKPLVGEEVTRQDLEAVDKSVDGQSLLKIQPINQIKAVARGMVSIIPPQLLWMLTWSELEMLVCGTPEINIELLKRHTEYSGMAKDDPRIPLFWKCLEAYSNEERRRFIKFAWGQKRIPSSDREWSEKGARFLLKASTKSGDPDILLPTADTCFFNVELPKYSSYEVMKRQLDIALSSDWGLGGDDIIFG